MANFVSDRVLHNQAKVRPRKETKEQRNERILNYLESGAKPICFLCDSILLSLQCHCTDTPNSQNISFAWPDSYTKPEKKANFLRWSNKFEKEIPKTKRNKPIWDVRRMAIDFLDKSMTSFNINIIIGSN